MNRLEYFKSRLEATLSPVDVLEAIQSRPGAIPVVDVRNGPASLIGDRIVGALQVPQSTILERFDHLPRDRELVLYCWDTWCSLAAQAAVPLLERGFNVRELYGGMHAWKTMRFPVEPLDAAALTGQQTPVPHS
jgi:rhodanese-related sulfurtransferase